jgi:hypothetical protein
MTCMTFARTVTQATSSCSCPRSNCATLLLPTVMTAGQGGCPGEPGIAAAPTSRMTSAPSSVSCHFTLPYLLMSTSAGAKDLAGYRGGKGAAALGREKGERIRTRISIRRGRWAWVGARAGGGACSGWWLAGAPSGTMRSRSGGASYLFSLSIEVCHSVDNQSQNSLLCARSLLFRSILFSCEAPRMSYSGPGGGAYFNGCSSVVSTAAVGWFTWLTLLSAIRRHRSLQGFYLRAFSKWTRDRSRVGDRGSWRVSGMVVSSSWALTREPCVTLLYSTSGFRG